MSKRISRKGSNVLETITVFDDGMTSNNRSPYGFAISKQFHHTADKLQLRQGVVAEGNPLIRSVVNETNDIYGLGYTTETIYEKSNFQSGTFTSIGSANYSSDTWLFSYKSYLFYYDGSNLNYFGDVTSSPTETTGYITLVPGYGQRDFVKPFVHPTDGYAYFFDRNNIYQLVDAPSNAVAGSDANWNPASITVPSHLSIQSACSWGEYIAIFGWDRNLDKTTMFLWDRSLVLEDWVDIKEWGTGQIMHSGSLNGRLFAIGTTSSGSFAYRTPMLVTYYTGSSFEQVTQSSLFEDAIIFGNSVEYGDCFVDGDTMYFTGIEVARGAATDISSSTYTNADNIFAMDSNGNITIAFHDSITNDDIKWFTIEGEVILYTNDSGTVYRTVSDADEVDKFTNPGIYVPNIFDGGDGFSDKKPVSVKVWHSPILTGGSIKVEYLIPNFVDDWVTVGTNSTAGATRTEFERLASGEHFPVAQEFYLRVTATKTKFMYGISMESSFITDANVE